MSYYGRAMNEQIIKEQEELKRRGRLYHSEIEGVSDLLWSIALSAVSADKETVKKWFNQKIPFLNDKSPVDILRNENKGEEMIYDLLMRIRYGGAS